MSRLITIFAVSLLLLCVASFASQPSASRIHTLDNGVQFILPEQPTQPLRDPSNPLDQGGEDCASATEILSLPYCDQGTTVGYNDDYFENCIGVTGAPDVVYRYSPLVEQDISISLSSPVYSTYLQIYETSTDCSGLTFYGCNNNVPTSCVDGITVYSGNTYYIVVDGDWQESGDYILHVVEGFDCPSTPCDDSGVNCDNPISASALPYCDTRNSLLCQNDFYPLCVTDFGGPDLVYEYIPTQDQFLGITTASPDFETYVEIWESETGCYDAYSLGCPNSYDGNSACINGVDVYAGYQYYIFVDGRSGDGGDYTLNIYEGGGCSYTSCGTGSGEDCADAITVNTMPFVYSGTTMGMSDDYNSCTWESGPDVVFSYTPDSTHLANILACGNTLFNADLYIFRDGDVFNLFGSCAPRPCYTSYGGFWWNPAFHCFQFEVGHSYCIVLDGESASSFGPFELTIEPIQLEVCNLEDICPFPYTETEPNSMCSPREFDPDTLFLGDTIAGNICEPGDIDYYWVVTPEDRWNVIGVSAGPNCDQGNTDLGISFVYPNDCAETAPCNNCGWISGCGPETVAVAIKGLGDCFAGTYKTFVWEYERPIDPCDPVACDLAPVINCNTPTPVNTCDGCQTPICQTYRNGNFGQRASAGLQKFFRLDVATAQIVTIDLAANIGDPYHDVQFSIFTDCTLPQTSCVYAQDQNTWWQSVTGPENEEHGSVFLTPGTYYIHVSVEGGGNCGDMTLTVGCTSTPCIPADSLTIRRATPAINAELRWPAHDGTYEIYSTIIPNNDGDPSGGDPDWSLVHSAHYPEGTALWTDPDVSAAYRNYVVVRVCP
ncbi:hypothetical protein IT157_02900 [bacterium]|nr:hypothetical protein [bacterium]